VKEHNPAAYSLEKIHLIFKDRQLKRDRMEKDTQADSSQKRAGVAI
jgi:hypothetical protein